MDPDVRVRSISDRTGLEALTALFMRVWRTGRPQVPFPVLRALSSTGGMVLGAYAAGQLVGGAVGLCGADPARRGLHSHIVAVDSGARRTGVGTAIKRAQRDWCLARGITTMTWTFDPLIRRNATFNIARLQAVGVSYHPDYYGPMDDGYNAGVPTDRVLVRWDLTAGSTPAGGAPHAVEGARTAPPHECRTNGCTSWTSARTAGPADSRLCRTRPPPRHPGARRRPPGRRSGCAFPEHCTATANSSASGGPLCVTR